MKYIDIHSHIHFPEFDADRDDVVMRAKEARVGMILVGTDLESSKKAIEIIEKYENLWPYMWAVVGLHPNEPFAFDHKEFSILAKHNKVVGIGECGLDYFRTKPEGLELQRNNFIAQIKLANEVKKPLMLHVRNNPSTDSQENSAYQESIRILEQYSEVKANFHFFAGNIHDIETAAKIGSSFSFTGVVTFTNDYDDQVRVIDEKHIMSETDCPFVAPKSYRGKRNESAYVVEVAKAIARIKGLDEEEMRVMLLDNAKRFFEVGPRGSTSTLGFF